MAAYDLKVLGERLKAQGLVVVQHGKELGEDAAEVLYKELSQWLKDSALESKTPFDDIAIPMLTKFDEKALAEIDKLDGKVGV